MSVHSAQSSPGRCKWLVAVAALSSVRAPSPSQWGLSGGMMMHLNYMLVTISCFAWKKIDNCCGSVGLPSSNPSPKGGCAWYSKQHTHTRQLPRGAGVGGVDSAALVSH